MNMEGSDDVVDLQAGRVHVLSNEKQPHGHHAKPCFVESTHGTDHTGFVGKWASSDATPAWWFPFSYEQPEPLRTLQHLPHAHTPPLVFHLRRNSLAVSICSPKCPRQHIADLPEHRYILHAASFTYTHGLATCSTATRGLKHGRRGG